MSTPIQRVVLVARPNGPATLENFRIEQASLAAPAEGEVSVALRYLSADPYMLRLISGEIDYKPGVAPGDAMFGRAVGEVVESRDAAFVPGDPVFLWTYWQNQVVARASELRKLDLGVAPWPAWLGVLGHSALTAWAGLIDVGRPRAGETVLVSAASGAVGSVVGQLAKISGCRAVGIAGGPDKCRHVVDFLGFDACVDYKAPDLEAQLAAALPDRVDVYFENVGGAMMDTVLPHMNRHGRIVVCGMISDYLSDEPIRMKHLERIMSQALRVEGFAVSEYFARQEAVNRDLARWYRAGQLKYHETISEGLESAPAALVGLQSGRNLGKQLVRVS